MAIKLSWKGKPTDKTHLLIVTGIPHYQHIEYREFFYYVTAQFGGYYAWSAEGKETKYKTLAEAKAAVVRRWHKENRIPTKTNTMATKKKSTRKSTGSKAGVKANGTLKKGYKYVKGGRVVKAKSK